MYFAGSVLRLPTHHSLVGVPLLYKSLSLPAFFKLPSSRGTEAHCVLLLISTQGRTWDGSERQLDERKNSEACLPLPASSHLIHIPRDSLWTPFKPLRQITVLLHDAGARLFIFFHCPVFLF